MKRKILVIEDEKPVRENLSTLLTEEGYAVLLAKNGEEGIMTARMERPDLIVCDIMMPGIDGYEVLNELSRDPNTGVIPFIFLTAKFEREDLRKGMQLGADDYIFKPFKADDLLKSIQVRLNRIQVFKGELTSMEPENNSGRYSADDRIFISVSGKPVIIKIKDIMFISADNQYSTICLQDNKRYTLRKSIAAWHEILPEKMFLRIHRSTIINLDYIVKIERSYNSSFIVYLKEHSNPFIISKRYSSMLRREGI